MANIKVNIKKVHENAKMPKLATAGAAAFDLYAVEKAIIEPYCGRVLISIGLIFDLPTDYCLKIFPRSGMSAKDGITVLNSPGIVDCDFTGVVKVILCNTSSKYYVVEPGDRIAQGRVEKNIGIEFNEVEEVLETDRNPAGFGTTGK